MISTGNDRHCQHVKPDGSRCGAWSMTDSAFCWVHNPATVERRQASRSAGGYARHGRSLDVGDPPPAALRTVEDVRDILEYALRVTLALEPSYRQVYALISVSTAALKVLEIGDHEMRLAVLEQQIANITATVGGNGRHYEPLR